MEARTTNGFETSTLQTAQTWSVDNVADGSDERRGWYSGLGLRNSAMAVGTTSDSGLTTAASLQPPGWKPLSLSAPILGFVIALTLLLAAAIETLAQRSRAAGGLALSPTLDDIPTYAMLAYLYVPNIVAVLYSLLWSWIDLDVKRMQPWFELSKKEGATAENSLFLDYQYDFMAFVPFRAAKKRHWPVFFAGTSMLIVLWLLTPFQSALLGTGAITKTDIVTIANRSTLRPLADQEYLLNPKVLNTAYAVGWLGQSVPAFTAPRYALLPFYPEMNPAPPSAESNWTATTTKLSTELSCWPARIVKKGDRASNFFHFLNGQGQVTIRGKSIQVKVRTGNYLPDSSSIQALSPREPLSNEEFNSTAFEYLLANGMTEKIVVKDFPFNVVVEQQPRLNFTGFEKPVSNMVGFALAGRNLLADEFSDPKLLEKVYHDAHQHLFSVAVSDLLMNETRFSNNTVSVDYFLSAIIVSRTFSIILDCTLALVAFQSCWLLLGLFDAADEKTLLESLRKRAFRLAYDRPADQILLLPDTPKLSPTQTKQEAGQKAYYEPVKPLALRREIGVLFVAVLLGAITGLSYLKEQEIRLNGLQRPSTSFEVLQLLENYIPTISATLIEPFWILLNRLLCVLQPFKDLWEGKAKPANSIDATYTSIPPQFALWRAIGSRHFILALLCATALLSNALAVGLGALFNEEPTIANDQETLNPAFAARFDHESVYNFGASTSQNLASTTQYSDHMYVALANLTAGTTLPPWVSQRYFFQRYDLGENSGSQDEDTFSMLTRGFGANANCTPIATSKLPVLPRTEIPQDNATCADLIDTAINAMRASTFNRTSGLSAVEYVTTVTLKGGHDPCNIPLTLGWGRTDKGEAVVNGTVFASFAICRPIFETAMFNLTVDSSGHVLTYERAGELETSLGIS